MPGIDLKIVQELIGRKSVEITLRYSHLLPDHKARAVEVFGRQMDTIWSPEVKRVEKEEVSILHNILLNKEL